MFAHLQTREANVCNWALVANVALAPTPQSLFSITNSAKQCNNRKINHSILKFIIHH